MNKEVEKKTVSEILKKLKLILGVNKSFELAKIFAVKANTISSWKTRGSIPFARLIDICAKYNIDLNDLFYDNYERTDIQLEYKQVPILYISSHWEYYFKADFRHVGLPFTYFPRHLNTDIIIQMSIEQCDAKQSVLVFSFCQRVDITALKTTKDYILLIQNRGFIYCSVEKIDVNLESVDVKVTGSKMSTIYMKQILEAFQFNGFLS